MPIKSLLSTLQATFPQSGKDQWLKIASHEIENQDPFAKLAWQNEDAIRFFPYYSDQDLNPLAKRISSHGRPEENIFFGARKWINAPIVQGKNSKTANQFSLEQLTNGADGLYFRWNDDQNIDLTLKDIEWSYCALYFEGLSQTALNTELVNHIQRQYKDTSQLSGAIFSKATQLHANAFFLNSKSDFKSLGISVGPSSAVSEISSALTIATKEIDRLSNAHEVKSLINHIAFSVTASADFLETIAKLRALRWLWFQIAQAYGVSDFHPENLLIHVTSAPWIENSFEPHGNMIKATTAGMAAVIGGCQALTICPQDDTNATQVRIARNISALLREESHLNKVDDPLAGAYAIEAMTNEFAKSSWAIFQKNMTA